MPERRRDKRVPARLRIWCESDDFTLLSETANVSLGGLFLRTSTPPPAGKFRISIDALGVVATVAPQWSTRGQRPGAAGVGLQITAFEHGAEAYRDYVVRLANRSGEHRIGTLPPAGPQGPRGPSDSS